eukprot:CAMPEP_0113310186 /NCGR_PEP_ID=MMETSP0010_2-20120614/7933_1 /TAXON_ID=216773 ORGANISM="Corethron hystrix, Strain 308" /NCGR_SAMPLE_ID=MMETSP0010_2 /ASSEMBLY_ACC=CAM_ASM_000155 /LENGTH=582 /DNA_ID=CAMNT_0000165593 /DNA_START=14 /DNA_END=1765 /DNA_ORIENTATION=- /assembly_acc=CAM_ASM_000155
MTTTVASENAKESSEIRGNRAVVAVLGDVGRSPRMMFHAESLVGTGSFDSVTMLGYSGERLIASLQGILDGEEGVKSSPSPARTAFEAVRFKPSSVPVLLLRLRFLRPLAYVWKVLTSGATFLWHLLTLCKEEGRSNGSDAPSSPSPGTTLLLVQLPPALPTLPSLLLLLPALAVGSLLRGLGRRRRRRLAVVLDWHNLGHTLTPGGRVVRAIAYAIERSCAYLLERAVPTLFPNATVEHLTVTQAMADYIQNKYGLGRRRKNITVLYDRPGEAFRPFMPHGQDAKEWMTESAAWGEVHELMSRLESEKGGMLSFAGCRERYETWLSTREGGRNSQNETVLPQTMLTEVVSAKTGSGIRGRPRRPAIVLSSTSWTPDEDFGILLDALVDLDRLIEEKFGDGLGLLEENKNGNTQAVSMPYIICVVTGKGPMKTQFERRMVESVLPGLRNVSIATPWLEPEDYPKLVGCADIGVSLHTSSSGIDLPMKVLDMFGCNVPVAAIAFPCLHELITEGGNGVTFQTASQLADRLYELLVVENDGGSARHVGNKNLDKLREGAGGVGCWKENWDCHAAPVVQRACEEY